MHPAKTKRTIPCAAGEVNKGRPHFRSEIPIYTDWGKRKHYMLWALRIQPATPRHGPLVRKTAPMTMDAGAAAYLPDSR